MSSEVPTCLKAVKSLWDPLTKGTRTLLFRSGQPSGLGSPVPVVPHAAVSPTDGVKWGPLKAVSSQNLRISLTWNKGLCRRS